MINFLIIIVGGFLGTIVRYFLCKIRVKNFAIGLLICNIVGCTMALIFIDVNYFLSLALFGSLTSMSSLVKESKVHIIITIALLFMVLSII